MTAANRRDWLELTLDSITVEKQHKMVHLLVDRERKLNKLAENLQKELATLTADAEAAGVYDLEAARRDVKKTVLPPVTTDSEGPGDLVYVKQLELVRALESVDQQGAPNVLTVSPTAAASLETASQNLSQARKKLRAMESARGMRAEETEEWVPGHRAYDNAVRELKKKEMDE
jgi:hypothetical protein